MVFKNDYYKIKYNKYKIKYLILKKEIEEKKIIQKGGIFKIFEQIGLSCNDYYNQTEIYKFTNFEKLKKFATQFSTNNNYSDTILNELIKIDFDIKNRFNELPELIKVLLHLRPKPAHILELLFDKNFCDDIKAVLKNQYKSKSNLSITQLLDFKNIPKESMQDAIMVILNGFLHGTKLFGYELTRGGINKDVLLSIKQILAIEPENEKTNIWDSLTKLLEFIGCMIDTKLFDYAGINLEDNTGFLKKHIIQIVFIDNMIKYKTNRKFSNFYKNTQQISNPVTNYDKFILMDFFDPSKNTKNILPPSVLLFLSIKLNPLINDPKYWLNNKLRYYIQYITNKSCNYQEEQLINQIEDYVNQNPPQEINLTQTDSNLIDVALVGLTNGTDNELLNKQEISSTNSLLTEAGIKYIQIMNLISDKIKLNIKSGLNSLNIFKSMNVFKPINPISRKQKLENKIEELELKVVELQSKYEKANDEKKLIGWFSSEKDKIKDTINRSKLKINDAKLELIELDKMINNKDRTRANKLNYILSNIILMSGIGIDQISRDLCRVNQNSFINWRTFDKLLKILDGKIFTIINLSASNLIKHLIIQYVVPYSIYLHLDLNRFFHLKLKLDQTKSEQFDSWYKEYETRIYQDYTNHTDGFYYLETDSNGKDNKNIRALFPPSVLLNKIKDSIKSLKI